MSFERSTNFNIIQNVLIHGSSSADLTADEDPWIEMFCILLKLVLHLKLINFNCMYNMSVV